jgi:RHS repeat-associated protein
VVLPFTYKTDLVGNVLSETYPSGRKVTTTVNPLDQVTKVAEGTAIRATAFQYAPHGGLQSVALGNGVTHTARFNTRLQTDLISAASSAGSLLSIAYAYWPDDASSLSNNGNVWKQTITATAPNASSATFTETYDYDGANRLVQATETGQWAQTYQLDRWGNRVVGAGYVPQPSLTPTNLAQISRSTNRLTSFGATLYDAGGNQTVDPLGRYLTYDAENRQIEFRVPAGGGQSLTTTHTYDGQGHRVRTVGPSGTTYYAYDASGRLAAEYSDFAPLNRGTQYVTTDILGSVRLVTDGTGAVVSRHDFLPFGEEIPSTLGRTAPALKYSSADALRHRFTGKERDGESALDYFGARYFSSQQGRFMSPDLPLVDQFVGDPQSWNLYGYARGNPLKFLDRNGRYIVPVNQATAQATRQFISTTLRSPTGRAMIQRIAADPRATFVVQGRLPVQRTSNNTLLVTTETVTPLPGTPGKMGGTVVTLDPANAATVAGSTKTTNFNAELTHVDDVNRAPSFQAAAAAGAAGDAPSQPGGSDTTGGTARANAVAINGELGADASTATPNSATDQEADAILQQGAWNLLLTILNRPH